MTPRTSLAIRLTAIVLLSLLARAQPQNGPSDSRILIAASSAADVRSWDATLTRLERDGSLHVRQDRLDAMVAGRRHVRLDQYHDGVRVFGGDVARQEDAGQTVSVFGTLYRDLAVDTTADLSLSEARSVVETRSGVSLGARRVPEIGILPLDDGGYALAYRARAVTTSGARVYFIDADSGRVLLEYDDFQSQAAIGTGHGVLGDPKKVSTTKVGASYRTSDAMRPPALLTFDLRGNLTRTLSYLNGNLSLAATDYATDADNQWTDAAVIDAHVHAGWTYDYYFKRFGRRGLDNNDMAITSLVHPVLRQDVLRYPNEIIASFYLNAGYVGDGVMVYGEGLPPGFTAGGQSWDYTSGALDIVAHELTHGVTDYSSRLIYRNESGALNEAFSDMMATAVEHAFHPPGTGLLRADYLVGEDVITPGGLRSMADPGAYGDPDHYSRRYVGVADNGGVHTNSGIANAAYHLAIEGGTNRTSGRRVDGVGGANREQIEAVFYRAFTMLLPSNATFSMARAATLQAARDLHGAGSAVESAVAGAWAAVGVP